MPARVTCGTAAGSSRDRIEREGPSRNEMPVEKPATSGLSFTSPLRARKIRMPLPTARKTERRPSDPQTFSEGDVIVYPTHGVGRVDKIAMETIAGCQIELIHLSFPETAMTVRVPVAKASSSGLRKLAGREVMEQAMGVLGGRAKSSKTMWAKRAQEYEAKINSGDPLKVAEVVRDLRRNAGETEASFSERQFFERAVDRLSAELAAIAGEPKAQMTRRITDTVRGGAEERREAA
jgi:CarD family transcriptional regulator